jgi:hypothetical protein
VGAEILQERGLDVKRVRAAVVAALPPRA